MNDFTSIESVQQYLRDFARDRDWDKFHAPKNLAMALAVESAELMELFQWLSESESAALDAEKLGAVREEMADVFLYLLRMADVLNIDLMAAAEHKAGRNEQRYPAEKVRGSAKKYSDYS